MGKTKKFKELRTFGPKRSSDPEPEIKHLSQRTRERQEVDPEYTQLSEAFGIIQGFDGSFNGSFDDL